MKAYDLGWRTYGNETTVHSRTERLGEDVGKNRYFQHLLRGKCLAQGHIFTVMACAGSSFIFVKAESSAYVQSGEPTKARLVTRVIICAVVSSAGTDTHPAQC
jgi:hypothetical protein